MSKVTFVKQTRTQADMQTRPRPKLRRTRFSSMVILSVSLLLGGTACTSPQPPVPGPTAEPVSPTADPMSDAVTGHVTNRDDGTPYAGAIVEFRNVYKAELHTETDSDGYYPIQLPPGVYTAFALDLKDINAGFDLVDPSDSPVTVPGAGAIDFKAYPVS